MYALLGIGNNVALLNKMLAEQLALNVEEFTSIFRVASGASAHFVGQLPKARLHLHDSLAVIIESISITGGAADCMSMKSCLSIFLLLKEVSHYLC